MMFTGTTQQQDTRFSDKEKKLMKQMKFGDCLNKRVDMSKVKLDVLRPWISKKITDILHIEDDVVVEFVYNQLEEEKFPCPKKMQINMTGFLNGRNARQFMGELWTLLLSAQESDSGIPAEFIQQKKEEILKREEEKHRHDGRSRSREKDRDKDNDRDRDRDRRFDRGRSSEVISGMTQRDREQQLPPSTLSAIEQVRSHLVAKSRSNSLDKSALSSSGKDKASEGTNVSAAIAAAAAISNRSKSPNASSRSIGAEAASNIRNRSPSRRSRERLSSRDHSSPRQRRRNSSRDRRRQSRSPKRRSPGGDRKRRRSSRSYSRERTGRRSSNYRKKSRTVSPQKKRESPKKHRSANSKSRSRSLGKRKLSPPPRSKSNSKTDNNLSRRKRSSSRNSYVKSNVNGNGNGFEGKRPLKRSINRRSPSENPSERSRGSPETKKPNIKSSKRNSRSRSLSKRPKRKGSSQSLRSSSRSSASEPINRQKSRRSSSRNTSLSPSPENRKEDFEIRRNKNSVQKKRHYRNNRDSSASSIEGERDRNAGRRFTGDGRRRRGEPAGRRFSPHGRSPRNEVAASGSIRTQRSRSRRRSKSRNRSRSRIRSRSPVRRSRSPRRFNRRRSPLMNFRGRGGNNRGRQNAWRRSLSRGRGGNGVGNNSGGRFDRRFSPQRRYSREKDRERRSSPMQNQFRKNSPPRRYSPQNMAYQQRRSRERRMSPNQRDRRPSSPKEFSRDRGGGGGGPFNRWDQPNRTTNKPQRKSTSESSNWEEDDETEPTTTRHRSVSEENSPAKNNGRDERSRSNSLDRRDRHVSPGTGKSQTARAPSGRRSSAECSSTLSATKAIDVHKEQKNENLRPTAASKEREVMQTFKPITTAVQRNERQGEKFSTSLSRTPSPFLKPHEREKSLKKIQEKRAHQNNKASESSSSDSSESEESDDDDEVAVGKTKKKLETHYKPGKRKSSTSEDKSNEEGSDGKNKMKGYLKDSAKTESIAASVNTKAPRRDFDISDEKQGDGSATEAHINVASGGSVKKVKAVSDTISSKKISARPERTTYDSSDDSESSQNKADSKSKRKSISKKQKPASSDSDSETLSKNKRKKSKKSSKRFMDESSSDSEEEVSLKKKKHKKHKKHSKKSKKHKKHKKKNKKADSSSSSDESEEIRDKSSKIPTATGLIAGVNEDLEKQLRERALKFNRRRSPVIHFRGRGANNRGRQNTWRRSLSRGRGGNGVGNNSGGRFDRRFSPQRRYSRENNRDRRLSPIQNRFRKISPPRRHSPHIVIHPQRCSRERRTSPVQQDRRPSSPREHSRDRGDGGDGQGMRWNQSNRNAQKLKPKSTSENSRFEGNYITEPKTRQRTVSKENSSARNNGRGKKSRNNSLDRSTRNVSPTVGTSQTARAPSGRRSSTECASLLPATKPIHKEQKSENHKLRAETKEKEMIQTFKPVTVISAQRIDKQREKFSITLSRTPSPFLKPHEKEKPYVLTKLRQHRAQQNDKESDSSSSDSSTESTESDDDDEEAVRKTKKKLQSRFKSEKHKISKSEDKSNEEAINQKNKIKTTATRKDLNISDEKRVQRIGGDSHLDEASGGSVKKLKTISDLISSKKVSTLAKRTIYNSSDDSESSQVKVDELKSKQSSLRKSISKKQKPESSGSDSEATKKDKRKKSKKSSKRFLEESSSESEVSAKKKKHKKHKKHSKKNKKHKKHKKKSKKADSSSSSDESEEIRDKSNKKGTTVGLSESANEDLEKKLRERALKSMKKFE